MVYLVENCFHWLGFHIVNHLLETGYQVDGMDSVNTDTKEHLSMFVGRNASFRHISDSHRQIEYDVSLSIDDHELILTKKEPVIIKLPLIFGEWMPMDEEGAYIQNDFIPFDSEQFLTKAVYVADILKSLEQWVKACDLPPVLEARSFHDQESRRVDIENSVYIRNSKPVQDRVNSVKKHYETHQTFYPHI